MVPGDLPGIPSYVLDHLKGGLAIQGQRTHKYAILSALKGHYRPWSDLCHQENKFNPVASNPRVDKFKSWISTRPDIISMTEKELDSCLGNLENARRIELWDIPKKINGPLHRALVAFREKLVLWEQITEKRGRVCPAKIIARKALILKHEFASHLDSHLEASLRMKIQGDVFSEPIYDFDENAWGHDYYFPPSSLPNFAIPEKSEDIERLFAKPAKICPKALEEFREFFRGYIINQDHKSLLDDVDYLGLFGSRSSFDPQTNKPKSHYHTHIGKRSGWDGMKPLHFKYKWIQKNAAEGRAAVICSPDTLYKIKWLHKAWKEHVKVPSDEYSNPRIVDQIKRILKNPWERKGFIMSDIKKSGLTFSRELNDIIFECLYEATGDERFQYFIGYGDAKVTMPDGQTRSITNGYGLGMMDCVISAAQACIFQIMRDRRLSDWSKSFKLDGFFWSDDSLGVVQRLDHDPVTPENCELVLQEWNEVMRQFGIIIHDEKPFYGTMGVFLEEYTQGPVWDSSKITQYCSGILDALTATDIVAAKDITSAVALCASEEQTRWTGECVQRVVDLWGYEFTPEESFWPYEIGGWTYNVKGSTNHLLQWMDEAPDNDDLTRASRLLKLSKPRRRLELHRKHESYIRDIVEIHGSDNHGAWSWSTLSSAALLYDYKATQDIVPIRKKILKGRLEVWKKPIKHSENESWNTMLEFCRRTCCFNWYQPLYSVLRRGEVSSYPEPYHIVEDEGSIRLGLASWNGIYEGSVKVHTPTIAHIRNDPERCFRHLIAEYCKEGPIPARDLEFIVMYGTPPWTWSNKIREKTEWPLELYGLPISPDIIKMIKKCMPEFDRDGSIFWSPIGAYCSLLDYRSDQWSAYGDYHWGVGMLTSKIGTGLGHKLSTPRVMEFVECFYENLYEPWLLPNEKKKGKYVYPANVLEQEHSIDQLAYYTQMVEGFASQVFLAEERIGVEGHDVPPDQADPTLLLEGDGMDSDMELGSMFG
jgi:hypothetical protein